MCDKDKPALTGANCRNKLRAIISRMRKRKK